MYKDKTVLEDENFTITPADAVLTRIFEVFQDRQHKLNTLVTTVGKKEEELEKSKNEAISLESEILEACNKFGFKTTVSDGKVRLVPPEVVARTKEKEWRCSFNG